MSKIKMGDIWGAQEDKPVPSPYDSPTRDMHSHEEMLWHLGKAKEAIDMYIGSGRQDLVEKACYELDITESEYRMCMNPESYSGIDLVRVQDIGRAAWKFHLCSDVTKLLHDYSHDKTTLSLSKVSYDRLYNRRYRDFTVNEIKQVWDTLPEKYRTAEQ